MGGWPSSGYPAEPAAPPDRRRRPNGRRAAAPGYGPPPGPPPARSGPAAGDGPRRPSGSGGGGRRWPRRLVWSLVALLGLGLLAPVVAFLVGWVMFDVPSANQTDGHPGRDVQVRRRRRAGHHPAGQRQPHDRPAQPGARARPARRAVGRGPVVLLQPRLRPDRHRPGAVEPGHRRGRRRLDHHPAVRQGLHRAGLRVAVAQVQGDRARGQDLPGADQGPDPRELPERRSTSAAAPTASRRPARPTSARTSRTSRSSEGAMLAGTIQSPSRWDPAKNPEKSERALELRPRRHGRPGLAAGRGPRPGEVPARSCRRRRRAAGSPATPAATSTSSRWTSSRPAGSPTRRSTPRA